MTATLTRLGALRTRAHGYYDAGEQAASTEMHLIEGLAIRLDDTGIGAPLMPGTGYELRPNDGWAFDRPSMGQPTPHWAHLVDTEGQPATVLPLKDGAVVLDRARHYVIRQDRPYGDWVVYEA